MDFEMSYPTFSDPPPAFHSGKHSNICQRLIIQDINNITHNKANM